MTEPTTASKGPMLARPALRAFVEAARDQAIAPTRLSAHEVQRAWVQAQRERKQTRKVLALGVGLGLAAAAMVGVITTSLLANSDSDSRVVDPVAQAPEPAATPAPLALDPAVEIRSTGDAARVLGPWTIALDRGEHEITLPEGQHALRIELPERTLELVRGELSITLVDHRAMLDHSAVVRLHSGIAAWVDADGTRTAIAVERIELPLEPSAEPLEPSAEIEPALQPSASALAREAERLLLAGRRDAAIDSLRELVRKHPRSPQARTALLDLAAQERLAGSRDRARCAYRLYVERWPHSEVRAEIDKQLAKLGEGPACRGLDPR